MSYGVFINGRRPTSKKQIKDAFASGATIRFENTSMFGGSDYIITPENDGTQLLYADGSPVSNLSASKLTFVGPDPYTDRRFYGNVTVKNAKIKIT